MTGFIEPWLAAYFDRIVARRDEAIDVSRHAVFYADGSKPKVSECHANVDRWVAENPNNRGVRGWAISSNLGVSVLLDGHSVIKSPEGQLIDITLTPQQPRAPFVRHLGSKEEFADARRVINQITWPPLVR